MRKPPEPPHETRCANCGDTLLIRPSRIAKSMSGLIFCSRACSAQYRAVQLAANAVCALCGKEFRRAPSEIGKHPNHKTYCSRECYDRARADGIANKRRPIGRKGQHEARCANCDQVFFVKPSVLSSRQQIYCSRKCKGEAMRTSHSHAYRIDMRKKHTSCQLCGLIEPAILQVHHLDGNHRNHRPENLIMVCPNCHARIHKGLIQMTKKDG